MSAHRNIANPELHQAMHGLRSSSATSPHQDRRMRRARTAGDALRAELALETDHSFEYDFLTYDPHVYDGERCIFCDVNCYDEGLYGPRGCVPHDGYIYSTETKR